MKIVNKRASFDYQILETFEAGIQLYGFEVKSVRLGHADLSGAHVRISNGEAHLIGAKIFAYQYARPEGYDESRTRKLLLHKSEIISLKSKLDGEKLTIVPLALYDHNHFIKIELALAKGKKQYDKKRVIKKRDMQRDLEQNI